MESTDPAKDTSNVPTFQASFTWMWANDPVSAKKDANDIQMDDSQEGF